MGAGRHGRVSLVKLYLSSFRLGRDRGVLRDLVGRAGRAALVFNACDFYGDSRLLNLERETEDISSLGFECEELDLRSYFGDLEGLRSRLDTCDLIWVVGGNRSRRHSYLNRFNTPSHGSCFSRDSWIASVATSRHSRQADTSAVSSKSSTS